MIILFLALVQVFMAGTLGVIDEVGLQRRAAQMALEDLVDFYFTTGDYDPPVPGLALEDLARRHHDASTYTCDNNLAKSIMQYQYHTPRGGSFNATKLLRSLRHRTLSIVGDSLGLQTFNGLDNELHSVMEPTFQEGGRGVSQLDKKWMELILGEEVAWQAAGGPRYKAARRYNREYNATVYFCNDATLDGVINNDSNTRDQVAYCVHHALTQAINTDGVLLLSMGAWYKPHYNVDDVEGGQREGDGKRDRERGMSVFAISRIYV